MDPQRKEQIDMLKAMLKGAKDDPKGAWQFLRDVVRERRNDPVRQAKRTEQREMAKGMLKGAKDDPKGAAIFLRDVIREERAKRKAAR